MDVSCCLCNGPMESHELLFFACPFFLPIKFRGISRVHANNVNRSVLSLTEERAWACSHKAGKSVEHVVYRLSLAASCYWIWIEQANFGVFQQHRKDVRGLIEGEV